jgi:crotonobetainyl-CoA:carnitine CoA-transferase CaiB-like acyl-CoA transferase
MLTGPYLTRILAQYGAEVIKVEKTPHGDPCREERYSALFELLNRGKKSVCIDFTKAEGRELVKLLASEADVFVENLRSGVMDKYGLGYADLAESNPDLIYVSLRGMADKFSSKSGHDLNFISTSGCGEWFLEGGANYSSQFADIVGGVFAPLTKLLVHLANPNRRGMHLISYADESFRSLYLPKAFEKVEFESSQESEKHRFEASVKLDGRFPNSRFYRCRDDQWISLQAIQKKHWLQFCQITDRQQWQERAEDLTLVPELEKMFLDAPAPYWEALNHNAEACLFRVVPWEEFLKTSQSRSKLSSDPLTWAGFASNPNLSAHPELGQDSFAIAHGLGYPNDKIGQLLDIGILSQKNKS